MPDFLTPPVISKLPYGLLGFLGIKSGGVYPQSLAAVLSPTWDQLELLAVNHAQDILVTQATGPGVNTIQPLGTRVPAGQVWYVPLYSVSVNTIAGENAILVPYLFTPAGVGQTEFALGPQLTVIASSSGGVHIVKGVWAGPNQFFGCTAVLTTAATITVKFSLRRVVFEI